MSGEMQRRNIVQKKLQLYLAKAGHTLYDVRNVIV